jgi:hypothetical protein
VLALVARVVFWAYTDRVWEDALITVTHARNAVEGLGLIHHVGEGRVQGFTSPVSVLVPLLGEWVHSGSGVTALRLASLFASVFALVYANRICLRLELSPAARIFVLAFIALDYHQILFGMAGMETEIAVAVLLAGFWYVLDDRPVAAGIALGAALIARPDFVLWVAAALTWLALRRPRRELLRAGAWAAIVGLPWYVFATAYYGTPIPETIKAKAAGFAAIPSLSDGVSAWASYLWQQPSQQIHLWKNLAPFLEDWPAVKVPVHWFLSDIAFAMIVLALVGVWATRAVRGWRPVVVFLAIFTAYLEFGGKVDWFSWYLPPFLAGVVLLVGAGITHLGRFAPRTMAVVAGVLAIAFVSALPFDYKLEWTVQHKIEDKVRLPLGKYLNAVVAPGQTVTSESSGYVGYYGQVKLLDYPGLTSPKALAVLKTIPRNARSFSALAVRLQPDWIVARPFEADDMKRLDPAVRRRYVLQAVFGVPESESELQAGPVTWQSVDREFLVLRRRDVKPLISPAG